jgi:Fe-S-cluster containining protein
MNARTPTPNLCFSCGACCREAFDSVPVTDADAARLSDHADLIRVQSDGWRDLERVPSDFVPNHAGQATRCIALRGDGTDDHPYLCRVYEQRPTNCRDLTLGSDGCETARERVGLDPVG